MLTKYTEELLSEHNAILGCTPEAVQADSLAVQSRLDELLSEIASDIVSSSNGDILSMKMDSSIKNGETVEVRVIFTDSNELTNKAFVSTGNGLAESIIAIISSVYDGVGAIKKINNIIKVMQERVNETFKVTYRWGLGSGGCKVSDWDYDGVQIKLSSTAINCLIKQDKDGIIDAWEDDLGEYQLTGWENVVQFLSDFDRVPIHIRISASTNGASIEELLTSNMFKGNDIMAIIKKHIGFKGTQRFKSIAVVKELGKFAAVVYWDVDYTSKSVTFNIQGEKVLDLENHRFISESGLYSRIEHRIAVPSNIITSLFESAN